MNGADRPTPSAATRRHGGTASSDRLEGIPYWEIAWLQAMPTIAAGEAERLDLDSPGEGDDLEQLAHLVLVDELLCVRALPRDGCGEQLDDAAVDQETRLRGVAGDVETGVLRGEREAREVDVRRDVLVADVAERIGVGAVRAVAHQGAAAALRVVVLRLGKAVVDEERQTAPHALGQAGDEGRRLRMDLGRRAGAEAGRERRPPVARAVGPGERGVSVAAARDAALEPRRAVEVQQIDRHRIEHLVADDDAVEHIGPGIEPAHARVT